MITNIILLMIEITMAMDIEYKLGVKRDKFIRFSVRN